MRIAVQHALRVTLILHGRENERHLEEFLQRKMDSRETAIFEQALSTVSPTMVHCGMCGESPENAYMKRSRCGACQKVMYCSKGCQKSHWRIHKKVCSRTK